MYKMVAVRTSTHDRTWTAWIPRDSYEQAKEEVLGLLKQKLGSDKVTVTATSGGVFEFFLRDVYAGEFRLKKV